MNAAAKDKKKITLTYGMFSVSMIFSFTLCIRLDSMIKMPSYLLWRS